MLGSTPAPRSDDAPATQRGSAPPDAPRDGATGADSIARAFGSQTAGFATTVDDVLAWLEPRIAELHLDVSIIDRVLYVGRKHPFLIEVVDQKAGVVELEGGTGTLALRISKGTDLRTDGPVILGAIERGAREIRERHREDDTRETPGAKPAPKRSDEPALSVAAAGATFTVAEIPQLREILAVKRGAAIADGWDEDGEDAAVPLLTRWATERRQFATYAALLGTLRRPATVDARSRPGVDVPETAPGQITHLENSCHVASVLTLLASVPAYRALFDVRHVAMPNPDGRALCALISPMLGDIHAGRNIDGARLRPLLDLLEQQGILQPVPGSRRPLIAQQQDAGAVLHGILQRVTHQSSDANAESASNDLATNVTRVDTTTYDKPSDGATTSVTSSVPVIPLTLVGPSMTLEQAILGTFAGEVRRDKGVKRPHTVTSTAATLPSVLTFQVTRQRGRGAQEQGLDAPQEFTFPAEITGEVPKRYRLQAFVLFNNYDYGYGGGHYVAYSRGEKGTWHESDDLARVTPVDPATHTYTRGQRHAFAMGSVYTYVQIADPPELVLADVPRVPMGQLGAASTGAFGGMKFGTGNDDVAAFLAFAQMYSASLGIVVRDATIWVDDRSPILLEAVAKGDQPIHVVSDGGTVKLCISKTGLDLAAQKSAVLAGLQQVVRQVRDAQNAEKRRSAALLPKDTPALFFTAENTVVLADECGSLFDTLTIRSVIRDEPGCVALLQTWAKERRVFPSYATCRAALEDEHGRGERPREGAPLIAAIPKGGRDLGDAPPGGVEHMKNSCYLASTLTLLAAVPAYRAVFDPVEHPLRRGSVGAQLQALVAPLLASIRGSKLVTAAQLGPLLDFLAAHDIITPDDDRSPAQAQQHDAAEVMTRMLDEVSDDDSSFITHAEETETTRYKKAQEGEPRVRQVESSNAMIQLWIPDDSITLERALTLHFGTEQRTHSDDGTKLKRPHAVRTTLDWIPTVLTLNVRRTQENGNDLALDAPQELTLPAMVSDESEAAPPRYRLQAFIARTGYESRLSHFVAYSKSERGQWFESDDIGTRAAPADPSAKYKAENNPSVEPADPATSRVGLGSRHAFAMGCIYTYVRIESEEKEPKRFGPVGEKWRGGGIDLSDFSFDEEPDPGAKDADKDKGKGNGKGKGGSSGAGGTPGEHDPCVHHTFEGWAKRQQLPPNDQVLSAYFRTEVAPAILALYGVKLGSRADKLVKDAAKLRDAESFEARCAIVAELVHVLNGQPKRARFDENEDSRLSNDPSQATDGEKLWKDRATAVHELLDIEHAAEARGVVRTVAPSGLKTKAEPERSPLKVIRLDKAAADALPPPLLTFIVDLYSEWRRGSWIDARPVTEVNSGTFNSEVPGSLRSWHQNSEGQLPDVSGTGVPEHASDFHDYYTQTSSVSAKQATKGTGEVGPIGYAEYTGNGIANDVHNCKVVFDYKTGLVYVTVTHYEAFEIGTDRSLKASVGIDGKGDHNPWFCFDLSQLNLGSQAKWGGAALGSALRPAPAPELRALGEDPSGKRRPPAPARDRRAPAPAPAADLFAQYAVFRDASARKPPFRSRVIALLDADTVRGRRHTDPIALQLAPFDANGFPLRAAFVAAVGTGNAAAANTAIMINNLWAAYTDQSDEIAAFDELGTDKYTKGLAADNGEKAHGDHLINNLPVTWRRIEAACGVTLLPPELAQMFRRMRSFAVRGPQNSIVGMRDGERVDREGDANSVLFRDAGNYLREVLLAAREVDDDAARRAQILVALRVFFESSRDRVVDHRANAAPELLMPGAKAQSEHDQWRKECSAQWNDLIDRLPQLSLYIDGQLHPAPVDWNANVAALETDAAKRKPAPAPADPAPSDQDKDKDGDKDGDKGAKKPASYGPEGEKWPAKRASPPGGKGWDNNIYGKSLPVDAIYISTVQGKQAVRIDRDDVHQILEVLAGRIRAHATQSAKLQENPQFQHLVALFTRATRDYQSRAPFVEFDHHGDTFYQDTQNHYVHPKEIPEKVTNEEPLKNVEETHSYAHLYQGILGSAKQEDVGTLVRMFEGYLKNGLTGADDVALRYAMHEHLATLALAVSGPEVRRNHLTIVINEMLVDLVRSGQLSFQNAFGGSLHPTARGGGENQTDTPETGGRVGENTYRLEAGLAIKWLLGAFSYMHAAPQPGEVLVSDAAAIQRVKARILEMLTERLLMQESVDRRLLKKRD